MLYNLNVITERQNLFGSEYLTSGSVNISFSLIQQRKYWQIHYLIEICLIKETLIIYHGDPVLLYNRLAGHARDPMKNNSRKKTENMIKISGRKVLMMYLVLADFNLISSGNS